MNENAERDGWVLVPREPTPDMLAMGDEAMVDTIETHNWLNHCRNAWAAMLAAAPPPPVQGEVKGQASSAHAAAMAQIAVAGIRLSYNPDLANSLATFSDFWGLDCYTPQTSTMNAVREIVRALLALSQAAPAAALAQAEGHSVPAPVVKVKPLEWEYRDDGANQASSPIGSYFIFPGTGFSYDLCAPVGGRLATYKRLEDAKNAGFDDFERRIRSALLEPAPAPAGVNAVEVARALVGKNYDSLTASHIAAGRHDEWMDVRLSIHTVRAVLAHLGIPDLSKQGEE